MKASIKVTEIPPSGEVAGGGGTEVPAGGYVVADPVTAENLREIFREVQDEGFEPKMFRGNSYIPLDTVTRWLFWFYFAGVLSGVVFFSLIVWVIYK